MPRELINDRINRAVEEHRRTGKAQRLKFRKTEFLEQNPDTPPDPRLLSLTGEYVILNIEGKYEEMTVGELREMCNKSTHAVAKQKRLDVLGLHEDVIVAILKEDCDLITGEGTGVISPPGLSSAPSSKTPKASPIT